MTHFSCEFRSELSIVGLLNEMLVLIKLLNRIFSLVAEVSDLSVELSKLIAHTLESQVTLTVYRGRCIFDLLIGIFLDEEFDFLDLLLFSCSYDDRSTAHLNGVGLVSCRLV